MSMMENNICFLDFTTGLPDRSFQDINRVPSIFTFQDTEMNAIQNVDVEQQYPEMMDLPIKPLSLVPSRKTSIDIVSCIFDSPNIEASVTDTYDSPNSQSTLYTDDTVPPFELTPSCHTWTEIVKEQIHENYVKACKSRRLLRMEIIKNKREKGLISFNNTVRYSKRSECAMKRSRSSGRFQCEVQYKNI